MRSQLLVGFSEISITPDRKVCLAGQFAERISQSVESPVTATAMAAECDGDQLVLCSCDLVSISTDLIAAVRERLGRTADGLDVSKVVVSATHTHTSLAYQQAGVKRSLAVLQRYLPADGRYVEHAQPSADVMGPEAAYDFLVERIAAGIQAAWRTRKPAHLANAFGRAAVGMNRRAVYSDGSAVMWGDTNQAVFEHLEGGSDSGIELLYIFDGERHLTGVVANIACPAQCVQHRLFVSSDFWGEVKRNLRTRFGDGLFVVGLCGAAGDQCPVDLIRWVEPESPLDDPNIERQHPVRRKADPSMFDIAGKQKVGQRIANEIIGVYDEAAREMTATTALVHQALTLHVPVRRVTIRECNAARRALEAFAQANGGEVDFNDNARMHVHAGTIARFEYQDDHDLRAVEVHIIRLGDIAIVTNPFELFLDYGNRMKARSLAAQTFIIQLAGGSEGYLPTARAERGGHYSAYVSSGITGHEGGDLLVRETLTRMNALWSGENA
jgi:hypothetical protein